MGEENSCFAEEGERLVIGPVSQTGKQLPDDEHYFVGIRSGLSSRYGWVSTLREPITPENLAQTYQSNPTDETVRECEILLKGITNLPDETPVACSFSETGILTKRRDITVHSVIFYGQ